MELGGVDLGRDGGELTDEELELWGGNSGVVSSNLDLFGGTAESVTFFMVCRSSGTSVHSTSETKYKKNQTNKKAIIILLQYKVKYPIIQ